MSMDQSPDDRLIDPLLSHLPTWQPPPDFSRRVAALAVAQMPLTRHGWVPLALRALAVAACVSVAAWLGAEVLYAGLLSMAAPETAAKLNWLLAAGSLVLVWRVVRRERPFRA
jgi:hypothetical protein